MSLKFGGTRLRLVVVITLAVVVIAAALAFRTPKDGSGIAFSQSSVSGGSVVVLNLSNLDDEEQYYLVPKNLESQDDVAGWGYDEDDQGSGTSGDPYLCSVLSGISPVCIVLPSSITSATVYIQTVNPGVLGDQST